MYIILLLGPVRNSSRSNTLEVNLQYDNREPPQVVDDNPILSITSGSTILIGPDVIQVTDADTPLAELRFTLEETPIAGDFFKKTSDYQVILRKGKYPLSLIQ